MKCDKCDKPAIMCSRDIVEGEPEIDSKGVSWRTWKYPDEKIHYRCKQHRYSGKVIYKNGFELVLYGKE